MTAGAIVTVYACSAVCVGFELSEAVIVKLNVPAVDGVPLKVAVSGGVEAGASVSPVGKVPAVTANPTGKTPPVLEMLAL
jgi:hypothetical protein